ncbi:MAG: CopG family transcriptional regulator [Salinibacterium sp.]|nr:CopG family transcriptional regulator [Salinibacterium sp.]
MHRTQIYVEHEQREALAHLAAERGVTASALIREAIDTYLAAQSSPEERLKRLRALGSRLASGATVTDHVDAGKLVGSLRTADAGRLISPA